MFGISAIENEFPPSVRIRRSLLPAIALADLLTGRRDDNGQ